MCEQEKILNINKPYGMSSCGVTEYIKKRFFPGQKVGHAGTLDPWATGVLLVCVGKATKKVCELMELEKEYEGEMVLGISTDTQDAAGKVVKKINAQNIGKEEVERVFEKFRGEIFQTPPMYSALRYKGKRLYELAREGKVVERQPRRVNIYELRILKFIPGDYPGVKFRVVCSRGTYIRTLVHEIGELLGCGAHLSSLTRTRIGDFSIENSIDLERIHLEYGNNSWIEQG